jgi:hypothetical protein
MSDLRVKLSDDERHLTDTECFLEVKGSRNRQTINVICQTLKVTMSSVTYGLGRENNILSLTNDPLLFLFVFVSLLADTSNHF